MSSTHFGNMNRLDVRWDRLWFTLRSAPPRRARRRRVRMARTTSRSTKGILRLPMICSRSCPFPATRTQSPGSALSEGPADGFATIGLDDGRRVHRTAAGNDFTNDLFGIFGPRIVAGDNRQIGRAGGPADQRTLAPIAVAAGSDRADHAASSQSLERIRRSGAAHLPCGHNR